MMKTDKYYFPYMKKKVAPSLQVLLLPSNRLNLAPSLSTWLGLKGTPLKDEDTGGCVPVPLVGHQQPHRLAVWYGNLQ